MSEWIDHTSMRANGEQARDAWGRRIARVRAAKEEPGGIRVRVLICTADAYGGSGMVIVGDDLTVVEAEAFIKGGSLGPGEDATTEAPPLPEPYLHAGKSTCSICNKTWWVTPTADRFVPACGCHEDGLCEPCGFEHAESCPDMPHRAKRDAGLVINVKARTARDQLTTAAELRAVADRAEPAPAAALREIAAELDGNARTDARVDAGQCESQSGTNRCDKVAGHGEYHAQNLAGGGVAAWKACGK